MITYQLLLALLLTVSGLVMLFLGMFLPPTGEIHSSVLVAFGEICTFAGGVIGVEYCYRYRYRKNKQDDERYKG